MRMTEGTNPADDHQAAKPRSRAPDTATAKTPHHRR